MMTPTWQQLVDAVNSGALGANSAKYSSYALDPNYTGDRNEAQWSDYASGKASGVGGPTSIETTEMGSPNKGRPEFRIINTPDGKGGVSSDRQSIDYSSDSGNSAMNAGVMAMLAAMGGAAVGGAGAGAAGTGEGMGAVGGAGYAAPTAEELAAGGFGTGGMGMTGAGGIGSASSVAGAGAGAAGYGGAAAAGSGILGGLGSSTLSNLAGKAVDTLGGKARAALLSSLLGGPGPGSQSKSSGSASSGGMGGSGVTLNAPANETPGMLAAQAAPQTQQQAIAQALLLGGPNQPQFNSIGYMPVPQGYEPNSQMMQLAQALQQDA